MNWDKIKKPLSPVIDRLSPVINYIKKTKIFRRLKAFYIVEDEVPLPVAPISSEQPEQPQGPIPTRADVIVDRIKRRDTITHDPATKGFYYSPPGEGSKRNWLMWGIGIAIAVIMIVMFVMWAMTPEPELPQAPPPAPLTYGLTLSVSTITVPSAHNQRIIAIQHTGGDTIANISTLWLVPWPSEGSGYGGGYLPKVDPILYRTPFKEGDTIYMYITPHREIWLNKTIPTYDSFVDLPNGKMKISVIDGRSRIFMTDEYIEVSNSMTYDTKDYGSIRNTMLQAPPYSTIFVSTALNQERLEITQPVRLISLTHSVIDGGNLNAVVEIKSNDVVLDGFEIRNSGNKGFSDGGVVIYPNAENNIIRNNNIHHTAIGVWIWGSNNNEIDSNIIHENDKQGVLLQNNAKENLIHYNNVYSNGADGILVDICDHNYIVDNTLNDNSGYGIEIPNYQDYQNVCEYNTGNDDLYCSDAASRGGTPRARNTPIVYSSEDVADKVTWNTIPNKV